MDRETSLHPAIPVPIVVWRIQAEQSRVVLLGVHLFVATRLQLLAVGCRQLQGVRTSFASDFHLHPLFGTVMLNFEGRVGPQFSFIPQDGHGLVGQVLWRPLFGRRRRRRARHIGGLRWRGRAGLQARGEYKQEKEPLKFHGVRFAVHEGRPPPVLAGEEPVRVSTGGIPRCA